MLHIGQFLVVDDALIPADAIVVLGGDPRERVTHAVALFEAGYADYVVLSGGRLFSVGLECSSALLALEDAEALGLPAEAVILAPEAQSTYDEAIHLRDLIEARDWQSLIIVTGPSHTRRTARTFRTLLRDITITVSAAPDPDYNAARWWSNEHSLVAVVNEVIKLAFYWVHHGICPIEA